MKLVTFEKSSRRRVGVLIDDRVVDLAAAHRARVRTGLLAAEDTMKTLPADMREFLAAGQPALSTAARAVEYATAGAADRKLTFPIDDVRLCAPVPQPNKVFALAGNYRAHIAESDSKIEPWEPVTPRVFMKPPSTTIQGPGDPIRIPRNGRQIDWEAELAVVIGQPARHVPAERAMDYVAGYTCFNDVSERSLKVWERSDEDTQEWDKFFDWLNGKWCDGFAPTGPVLATRDEVPHPHDLRISLTVNDDVMQDANTADMIFRVDRLVEYISGICTLEPGDLIATGTPSGVGMARGVFLKPGDNVRVQIDGVGVLENPVAAA